MQFLQEKMGGKSYLSVLPVVEELHGECSAEIW